MTHVGTRVRRDMHVIKHIVSMEDDDHRIPEKPIQNAKQAASPSKQAGDDKSERKQSPDSASSPKISPSPSSTKAGAAVPPSQQVSTPISPAVPGNSATSPARPASETSANLTTNLSADIANRPWTSRPDNSNVPIVKKKDEDPAKMTTDPNSPNSDQDAVAKWLSHLKRDGGKIFEQGLVDQPAEDEAGRTLGDVFPPRTTEEVAEEFPTANRNCQGPCHPLCHIRPMRAVTRANQLSHDNPFIAHGYQEIASERCNYPDLPESNSRAATKLYHLTHGDVIMGTPGNPESGCPMCRHQDPILPPFGQECCTQSWNRFHRLAKVSATAPNKAQNDVTEQQPASQ